MRRKLAKMGVVTSFVLFVLVMLALPVVAFADDTSNVIAHFDVNGGKLLAHNTLAFDKYGKAVVLPCPDPPNPSLVFAGWYAEIPPSDGSTQSPQEIRVVSDTASHPARFRYMDIRDFCDEYISDGNINLRAHYELTDGMPANDKEARKIDVKVKKWTIKSVVKVNLDRARYAKSGVATMKIDIKIGTATLTKKAKTNMVVVIENFYNDANPVMYKLIIYKDKAKAEVYSRLTIRGSRSKKYGKKFKELRNFRYSSYSCDCNEHYCENYTNIAAGYAGSTTRLFPVPNYKLSVPFYGKTKLGWFSMVKGSFVTGPTMDKKITYVVTNKKQSLGGKLNKKSPYYKNAKKMVGQYSTSCHYTAMDLVRRTTKTGVNNEELLIPLDQAKSGDYLHQQGHESIYLGGAQSLHGSVTTHKTWIGRSEIRKTYYVARPYWNIFYVK